MTGDLHASDPAFAGRPRDRSRVRPRRDPERMAQFLEETIGRGVATTAAN